MANDSGTPIEFPVVVRLDGTIFVSADEVRSAGFTPGTPLRLQAHRDEQDFGALLEAEIVNADVADRDENEIANRAVEATRKVRRDRAQRGQTGSAAPSRRR